MKGIGGGFGNCTVALLLGAGLLLMTAHPASAYPGGVSGAAITGCTCHGATANTGVGVTVTGLPESGYGAGEVYPLTVTVNGGPSANSGDSQAGFDLEVTAGSLAPMDDGGMTQACSDPFPQGATKAFTCVPASSGTAITHTEDGNKEKSWTVNWTAPTLPLPVALFVAGNKVNGDGGTSGDAWNTNNYTVVPTH